MTYPSKRGKAGRQATVGACRALTAVLLAALMAGTGAVAATAQPSSITPPTSSSAAASTTTAPQESVTATETPEPATPRPMTAETQQRAPSAQRSPTTITRSAPSAVAPTSSQDARPAPRTSSAPTNTAPAKKKPAGKWHPTKNPKSRVIPGQMRSDREEVPGGFTKAQADKAETMEAHVQAQPMSLTVSPAGCQVFWPAPYQVCGAILDKYLQTGGPNGFLLYPKTNELVNPDRYGRRSEFVGGNIYWTSTTGAHPVAHDFLTKWGQYGYEGGFIGYPTTDEIVLPDNVGRRQEFQGASIYWSPNTGAHNIQGAIRQKWLDLGAERADGLLGYPSTDEIVLPDGQGRMNRFEQGVVYWSPTTGAHEVAGVPLIIWTAQGYERSHFGYPTGSQSFNVDQELVQPFQGGILNASTEISALGTESFQVKM